MGSFNTTCMVSQQVIAPNDEVVIFPIVPQSSYSPVELIDKDGSCVEAYGHSSSSCYPTAFWNYAGPMLIGTYDDYGKFELENTVNNINNINNEYNHNNVLEVNNNYIIAVTNKINNNIIVVFNNNNI